MGLAAVEEEIAFACPRPRYSSGAPYWRPEAVQPCSPLTLFRHTRTRKRTDT